MLNLVAETRILMTIGGGIVSNIDNILTHCGGMIGLPRQISGIGSNGIGILAKYICFWVYSVLILR